MVVMLLLVVSYPCPGVCDLQAPNTGTVSTTISFADGGDSASTLSSQRLVQYIGLAWFLETFSYFFHPYTTRKKKVGRKRSTGAGMSNCGQG